MDVAHTRSAIRVEGHFELDIIDWDTLEIADTRKFHNVMTIQGIAALIMALNWSSVFVEDTTLGNPYNAYYLSPVFGAMGIINATDNGFTTLHSSMNNITLNASGPVSINVPTGGINGFNSGGGTFFVFPISGDAWQVTYSAATHGGSYDTFTCTAWTDVTNPNNKTDILATGEGIFLLNPSASDTTLFYELSAADILTYGVSSRNDIGSISPSAQSLTFQFYFGVPNEDISWAEAGLFANATDVSGSGTMLDHALINPVVSQTTVQIGVLQVSFTFVQG